MIRIAILLAAGLVSACSGMNSSRQGTVPSYRQPFVNAPANAEPQPPGSLPR